MENKKLEEAYQEKNVVWTESEPPRELVRLIEDKKINPCKVLDIGCGEGYNSIYLASRGFDVLGIDISKKAIKYAKENAKKFKVKVQFKEMNIKDINLLNEKDSTLSFIPLRFPEEHS